jgi:hypothetical protein
MSKACVVHMGYERLQILSLGRVALQKMDIAHESVPIFNHDKRLL